MSTFYWLNEPRFTSPRIVCKRGICIDSRGERPVGKHGLQIILEC